MRSNRLQLNADKTEVLWFCGARLVGNNINSPAAHWRSTVQLFPGRHPSATSEYISTPIWWCGRMFRKLSRCFAVLRQLHQIRRSVSQPTFQLLVVTLVNSRLDYSNGALIGLVVYLTRRLQSVPKTATRLIFNLRRSNHVSDALISLYRSQWSSGNTLACCARGPRFEACCGQKFVFSRKSLRYTALGTGCTLTAVPRSTQPCTLRGTVNEYQPYGWVIIHGDGRMFGL